MAHRRAGGGLESRPSRSFGAGTDRRCGVKRLGGDRRLDLEEWQPDLHRIVIFGRQKIFVGESSSLSDWLMNLGCSKDAVSV